MGAPGERGISTMGGCFASSSSGPCWNSPGFCATSDGAVVEVDEGTEEDALKRISLSGTALAGSEEREADPRRYSLRSRDRHSSQNTADVSHGLLQRKHWLICNSSHLPGRYPHTRTRWITPPPPLSPSSLRHRLHNIATQIKNSHLMSSFCTNRTMKYVILSHQASRGARGTTCHIIHTSI